MSEYDNPKMLWLIVSSNNIWFVILDHLSSKALHSIIVIVYSIKIWVGTSIFQKFWNNFKALISIYSEYSVFRILQKYKSQNIPPFAGPTYYVFDLKNVCFWPQNMTSVLRLILLYFQILWKYEMALLCSIKLLL